MVVNVLTNSFYIYETYFVQDQLAKQNRLHEVDLVCSLLYFMCYYHLSCFYVCYCSYSNGQFHLQTEGMLNCYKLNKSQLKLNKIN